MKQQYKVSTVSDYRQVITDLLAWQQTQPHNSLVIALQGDLGAGKTTFVQQVAQYFGVAETVASPTFTIMKQYMLNGDTFTKLVHIDAYRIESEAELAPLHIGGLLEEEGVLACVEWPEHIQSLIPKTAVWLRITIKEDEVREVTTWTGLPD